SEPKQIRFQISADLGNITRRNFGRSPARLSNRSARSAQRGGQGPGFPIRKPARNPPHFPLACAGQLRQNGQRPAGLPLAGLRRLPPSHQRPGNRVLFSPAPPRGVTAALTMNVSIQNESRSRRQEALISLPPGRSLVTSAPRIMAGNSAL